MINSKKKGNAGENKFANWLGRQDINAIARNRSSGSGTMKSDVHNALGINFEVKTVKKINLKKCWEQTKRDSEMSHTTPYLVIHLDGMPEDNWLMVMDNFDWIEMFKKSQEPKTMEKMDLREQKWAVQNLINSAKKVLKYLE